MKIQELFEKINNDITDRDWRAEKIIALPDIGELVLRARNTSHVTPPQFVVDVFTPDNKNIGYFRFLVIDWEKPKTGWFARKSTKDPYVIGGNVSVWSEYQKKGIARAVYQWVKSLGNDVRPSTTQTAAGKSMWRSFEKNPLEEAKTTREDFEGMTIEMIKNGHVLVIHALDDWGNNVLGSVVFNIGDDNDLDPQDLKVDERYQGQGIARIMYDYAKSKGYEIHRSYDQTDAGRGFWDKHRGEDVRVWEAFDNPYKGKWEKSDYSDSVDMLVKLPDGTPLSIMFNMEYDGEGEEVVQVEFHRNNSQDVTGEGDAQRIFATVLDAIQKYIKKYKPQRLSFSASKQVDMDADDVEHFNPESRAKLYTRLVQRYAGALGYQAQVDDNGDVVIYQLTRTIAENFADGRNPQDKGDSKRHGINTKASVSSLRKTAKNSSGRKQQLAHWLANMKAGRAKARRK
jgi:GNAT superfamily N-acetyltransferase